MNQIIRDNPSANLFCPAYFCNQSLAPTRKTGVNIVFYDVDRNLAPDWEQLESLIDQNRPDLFLLVHYFGRINPSDRATEVVRKQRGILIEDCAHLVRPAERGHQPESVLLFSPHKTLGTPLSSFLAFKKDARLFDFEPNSRAFALDDLVWTAKHASKVCLDCLSYFACFSRQLPATPAPDQSCGADSAKPFESPLPGPTRMALMVWQGMENRIDQVEWARIFNLEYLTSGLKEAGFGRLLGAADFAPEETPYLLPLVLTEDAVPIVDRRLREKGILSQTWPDLPPEVEAEPGKYPGSIHAARTRLFLPVHQSLKPKALDYILAETTAALRRFL